MRSNLFKYCAVILGILMICFSSFSCAGKKTPAYLLVGSEDNGWVPSYRAYFSVDGDEAKKISKHRFESLIYDDDIEYKTIAVTLYSTNAYAASSDPSDWEFVEYKDWFDDIDTMDFDTMKKYLKEMGVSYKGEIYIEVLEFDGYTALEVESLSDSTVKDSTSGLFRDGKMIELPKNVTFRSVNDVYRLEN